MSGGRVLDAATTALELLAVALLVTAAGWAALVLTPGPLAEPAALASAAVVAVVASRVLLWLGGERG